jgi:prepilin-type N-terminal cleavage/methylation domain-containing protein
VIVTREPRPATAGFTLILRRSTAGFTLIEVLAVLAIAGIAFAVLGSGMRFGLWARDRQARDVAAADDIIIFDQTLRRLAGDIDPGLSYAEPAQFDGNAHTVRFRSGDRTYRLLVASGRRLVLEYSELFDTVTGDPRTGLTTLLDNVERLDIQYWRAGIGWVATWPERGIPALIRFHVRLREDAGHENSGRHVPDVIAATMRKAWRS